MTEKFKLLVFGCGNMSQSLLEGMGLLGPSHFEMYFYTPTQVRARECAKKAQGKVIESLEVLPPSDLVMLAMKPQQFLDFAQEVKGKFSQETMVISLMAGLSLEQIAFELDTPVHQVMRLMPNTPCSLSAGVIPYYSHAKSFQAATNQFLADLSNAGFVAAMNNEEDLDLVTPYSGSGPGYLFEFARLWAQDLQDRGLDKKTADQLVRATFYGAAKMMSESSLSLEQLRDNVTSKAGVTAAALNSLEQNQLGAIINQAMNAAIKRNAELKLSK